MKKPSQIINYSVGICAYNEEGNIGQLIQAILKQKHHSNFKLKEVIVVTSGCTDKTVPIVRALQLGDPRIKLVIEKERRGKASAVNLFLKNAKSHFLVLESADTIPHPQTFGKMLTKLQEPSIALVGCRVKPMNDPQTFMGFTNHLMWELHHRLNLQFPERPKVGELVAFKKIFKRIPPSTAADEASIEPLVVGQEYKIGYCPDAVVYNKGPESVFEYLSRRRRNYAGHTAIRQRQGYSVVTYSSLRILGVLLSNVQWNNPRFFLYTPVIVIMEMTARFFGTLDFYLKPNNLAVWKIAKSSKTLN